MRQLFFSCMLLFLGTVVFGQTNDKDNRAEELTGQIAAKYQLDEKQKAEMLVIQQRKFRNLSEIEPYKKSNPPLYIQKIRALQQGIDGSIRNMLNKAQLEMYQQQQADARTRKAVLYQELKDAGASSAEIDYRMADLELEVLVSQ